MTPSSSAREVRASEVPDHTLTTETSKISRFPGRRSKYTTSAIVVSPSVPVMEFHGSVGETALLHHMRPLSFDSVCKGEGLDHRDTEEREPCPVAEFFDQPHALSASVGRIRASAGIL